MHPLERLSKPMKKVLRALLNGSMIVSKGPHFCGPHRVRDGRGRSYRLSTAAFNGLLNRRLIVSTLLLRPIDVAGSAVMWRLLSVSPRAATKLINALKDTA